MRDDHTNVNYNLIKLIYFIIIFYIIIIKIKKISLIIGARPNFMKAYLYMKH